MEYEQQQPIQVQETEAHPAPFWQTEWMWTGVVVPIVVAWIIHRRVKNGKKKLNL